MVSFNIELINTGRSLQNNTASFLSKLKNNSSNIFFLSETKDPLFTDPASVRHWLQLWNDLTGGYGVIPASGRSGILWKFDDHSDISFTINDHPSLNDRVTDIYLSFQDYKIRLTAVYAPTTDLQSSSKDENQLEKTFFSRLRDTLCQDGVEELPWALGGDWNCVLDATLDQVGSSSRPDPPSTRQSLQYLLSHHGLKDSYRHFYPKKIDYTNDAAAHYAKRRLDRLYLSADLLGLLQRSEILTRQKTSTHRHYRCTFADRDCTQGRGVWKGKHTLLSKTEYRNIILQAIAKYKRSIPANADPIQVWEDLKKVCIDAFKQIDTKEKATHQTDPDSKKAYTADSMRIEAGLPPQAMTDEAGSVKLRVSMVRRSKQIAELRPGLRAPATSSPQTVLRMVSNFYRNLYQDPQVDDWYQQRLLRQIPASQKLSSADVSFLDKDLAIEELDRALSKSHRGKAPGPDGLSVEFYRCFWNQLRLPFHAATTASFQRGYFSESQVLSHIHLVWKKGDKDNIRNYRPISLMNVDMKIITLALNRRLLSLLPTAIHPNQRGFIPDRVIDSNITEIQTITEWYTQTEQPLYMASLDFEKAYDQVSRHYLLNVLSTFGLPTKFVSMVRASLAHSTASAVVNGHVGPRFDVASGVKQGDPLSPTLFALAVEPLLCALRQNTLGISANWTSRHVPVPHQLTFDPTSLKVSAFADDVTIVQSSLEEIVQACTVVDTYCRASGSRLNSHKSTLIVHSPLPTSDLERQLAHSLQSTILADAGIVNLATDHFRHLGAQIGRPSVLEAANIGQTIVEKAKRRAQTILMYDLPIRAQTWILNTYVLSTVLFADTFNPLTNDQINEISELVLQKIRGPRKKLPVTNFKLHLPPANGGYGLWNLTEKLLAHRASHFYRLLIAPSFARSFIFCELQSFLDRRPDRILDHIRDTEGAWKNNAQGRRDLQEALSGKSRAQYYSLSLLLQQQSLPTIGQLLSDSLVVPQSLLTAATAWANRIALPAAPRYKFWIGQDLHGIEQSRFNPYIPFPIPSNLRDIIGEIPSKVSFRKFWEKLIPIPLIPLERKVTVKQFHERFQQKKPSPTPQEEEAWTVWKRLKNLRKHAPVAADICHRFFNFDLPNIGEWSQEYLTNSPYIKDASKACMLCRQATDKVSHLYFNCTTTVQLIKNSPLAKLVSIARITTITSALWIKLFLTPEAGVQVMKFIRSLHEMNHTFRYSLIFTNSATEAPIMQAYVNHCVSHRHSDFLDFHRRYHRDDP